MTWYSDLPHDQAGGDGGVRSITQMVVIHATDNTASDEGEAGYAETRSDHTSAHFYSDEDSVIQALDTDHIAFGCFPTGNSRSVQVEISGLSNHLSDASLRRVAPVVARVCQEYGLPIQHVDSLGLRNGIRGISGHLDVTYAWGEGDHTDPGTSFPWQTFIGYVRAALNQPAPSAPGEDDEEMSTGTIPAGFAFGGPDGREDLLVEGIGMGPVNGGTLGNKRCVLGLSTDFAPAAGVQLRLAVKANGKAWGVQTVTLKSADDRWYLYLPDGCTKVNIGRMKRDTGDVDLDADGKVKNSAETCPVWWDLEFEKR